jgi:hypothetical protein
LFDCPPGKRAAPKSKARAVAADTRLKEERMTPRHVVLEKLNEWNGMRALSALWDPKLIYIFTEKTIILYCVEWG